MIKTKNLDNLLNTDFVFNLLKQYQSDCGLSDNFKVINISRTQVISPLTYALLYEIENDGKIKKIRLNASGEETRIRSYEVMKKFESEFSRTQFSIPKPLFFNEDYNVTAYENVDGNLLINELKDTASLTEKVALAAQWLNKFHSLDGKKLELPEHKPFYNFEALNKHYPELADKGPKIVETLLSKIQVEEKVLIHGDFQPNNIVIVENKITVFDFNDSQYAYRTIDIAKFLAQLKVMLTRFSDILVFSKMEKSFLEHYQFYFNHENYKIYLHLNYLQILCSLAASLEGLPESKETLPKIYKYWEESNV